MMKAKYLIALVCISLTACVDKSQESTTSRADRIQTLKEDLDKTFGTGRVDSARIENDDVHLKTEKGNIVIPLNELEKLEQGASMDVKGDPSFSGLQPFNKANTRSKCEWVNCDDEIGQKPRNCKYHC